MKLYAFESCPYCVRVRVMLGLKGLSYELVMLAAGTIPESLQGEIGKMVVPLLEPDSGSSKLISESAEIIRWLDNKAMAPMLDSYRLQTPILQWLDRNARTLDSLFYPRMLAADLPELATMQAQQFFRHSRPEKLGCSLEQAIADTDRHVADLVAELVELEAELDPEALLVGYRPISFDDIAIFAVLRNLQMVDRVVLSPLMKTYMASISKQADIPELTPVSDALSLRVLSA